MAAVLGIILLIGGFYVYTQVAGQWQQSQSRLAQGSPHEPWIRPVGFGEREVAGEPGDLRCGWRLGLRPQVVRIHLVGRVSLGLPRRWPLRTLTLVKTAVRSLSCGQDETAEWIRFLSLPYGC